MMAVRPWWRMQTRVQRERMRMDCTCSLLSTSGLDNLQMLLWRHVWAEREQTMRLAIPACCYALQNNLVFLAIFLIEISFRLIAFGFYATTAEIQHMVDPIVHTLDGRADRIARDVESLHGVLAETAAADEFTGNLLRISQAVEAEGVAQPHDRVVRRVAAPGKLLPVVEFLRPVPQQGVRATPRVVLRAGPQHPIIASLQPRL